MRKNDGCMNKRRTKVTEKDGAFALKEGAYWDRHSLAEAWDQTRPVKVEVNIKHSYLLLHLKPAVASKLERAAHRQHLSVEKWLAQIVEKEVAIAVR
jgi:hypothetical protein